MHTALLGNWTFRVRDTFKIKSFKQTTYTWKITEGTKTWTESALINMLDHRIKWAEKHTSHISDKVQVTDYAQLMLEFMDLVAQPPPSFKSFMMIFLSR
jgi:hypothetical protein